MFFVLFLSLIKEQLLVLTTLTVKNFTVFVCAFKSFFPECTSLKRYHFHTKNIISLICKWRLSLINLLRKKHPSQYSSYQLLYRKYWYMIAFYVLTRSNHDNRILQKMQIYLKRLYFSIWCIWNNRSFGTTPNVNISECFFGSIIRKRIIMIQCNCRNKHVFKDWLDWCIRY